MKNSDELKEFARNAGVLYVEDDPFVRKSTNEFLKTLFARIDLAEDGKEGLELYDPAVHALVITDIDMPGMNGIAMVKAIKERCPDQAIIVTSGYSEGEYLIPLINLSIDRFILKPIDIKFFAQILRDVLKRVTDARSAELLVLEREKNRTLLLERHRLSSIKEVLKNIAHHWRQPLNIISLIASNIALELDKKGSKESIKEETQLILSETQALSKIIDIFNKDLTQEHEIEAFPLIETVKSALFARGHRLEKYSITHTISIDKEYLIKGNRVSMRNILESILDNAIDAIEQAILAHEIERGIIEITLTHEGSRQKLSIRDNGCGIGEDGAKKAFDPYYTTKFKSRNTGLSLYLARFILLDIFGADIEIEPSKSGSVVQILF